MYEKVTSTETSVETTPSTVVESTESPVTTQSYEKTTVVETTNEVPTHETTVNNVVEQTTQKQQTTTEEGKYNSYKNSKLYFRNNFVNKLKCVFRSGYYRVHFGCL